MNNKNILIVNALLLYDNKKILNNYAVWIKDSIIKEIGKTSELEKKYYDNIIKNDIVRIDAKNQLVIPGLINSHMHFYSTFARGIPLDTSVPNKNFLDILKNLWWKLDKQLTKDDIYYSAIIQMIGAIKNGTTTLIDHHASPCSVKGSLEVLCKTFQEIGLRGSVCYEVSDRDGKEICEMGIEENINFIKKYNKMKDSNIKGLFGLHAAFTLNNDTLNKIQDYNLNCGFHVHVSEAIDDNNINLEKYNLSALERLHKFGITGENSIFAHCNHLSERDIEIIKKTGTNIIHNPQSNMNNSVGTADVIKYINEGITVGLGTDGMSPGMFDAVNFASLIHKHSKRNSNIGFNESYIMTMVNNPKIASKIMGYKVGKIKEDYKADIIILDYIPATPLNENNFWGHFLFGIVPSARIETTIANGKILMENYKIKIIDEEEIYTKSRELAKDLWGRF